MNIGALRRASPEDCATLVNFRVRLQREVHGEESDVEIQARWLAFFLAGMQTGEVIAWVAESSANPIAVAVGYLRPYLPREGYHNTSEARVHNVFVDPPHRRRGVGKAMVNALIDDLRARAPYRIVLSPTDEARPLYTALGFRPSTEMVLKL